MVGMYGDFAKSEEFAALAVSVGPCKATVSQNCRADKDIDEFIGSSVLYFAYDQ